MPLARDRRIEQASVRHLDDRIDIDVRSGALFPAGLDLIARTQHGDAMFFVILDWEAFKVWLSATLGLSHHDIHLILGLALTFGFGWLLRRPLGAWLPLGIVFVLELINEAFDFIRNIVPGWPLLPGEALVDIAITIVPPLAIILAARWNSRYFYHFRRREHIPVKVT